MESIPEWTSALANLAIAVAACFAAWQGVKGLSTWRHETVGRRRVELAEETLAAFYEAVAVIDKGRDKIIYSSWMMERPGRDLDEGDEDVRWRRDSYYVLHRATRDQREFFARFHARRFRVVAAFGRGAGDLFERMQALHQRHQSAVSHLYHWDPRSRPFVYQVNELEPLERIAWRSYDNSDPFGDELLALEADAEGYFGPELQLATPTRI